MFVRKRRAVTNMRILNGVKDFLVVAPRHYVLPRVTRDFLRSLGTLNLATARISRGPNSCCGGGDCHNGLRAERVDAVMSIRPGGQ